MDWERIIENALQAAFSPAAIYFALAAIGLNIHFGYTGLLNFGQAGFLAMGAYGVAISVEYYGWNMWVGLLVGFLAAVGFGLLLGIPTLRLRADYLAIVTIAAAETLRLMLRAKSFTDFTGGSSGINGFAGDFYDLNPFGNGTYGFWLLEFDEREFWVMVVGWLLVALVSVGVFLLMRSPWGRVLRSIRDDEDAARSLGKNVFSYKMQSLLLGGVIGAFGGWIFAIGNASVQPDLYGTALTFFALTALILGGMARVFGPVAGAMVFWAVLSFTDNVLREAVANEHIPRSIMTGTQVGQVRFMLVGVALMLLPIVRPQGLFGNKREIELDI